jgi:uncharacterized protein
VKKISLLILCLALAAPSFVFSAQSWPAYVGYVNDFAHVVSADKAQALEGYLGELEKKTGAQVAVVTVPSVEGADIDGAAVDLFKAWGIGQKGKDNGILILAAIQDHKARIEVGYGLEAVITDGTAGDILRQGVFPQFKLGDYGQGLTNAAAAVAERIAQNAGVVLDNQVSVQNAGSGGGWDPRLIYLIIFIIYILFRIFFSGFGRRRYWGGGFYGGGWGSGGGGFSGGGGGGFGGFSGGGSGGGGASGSW